jgi:tetrahydromethanopterin S-methyltransferase subunit G
LNNEHLESEADVEDNRTMSEDPTQNLLQDGLRQILARLDSIDSRLTALEDKVDRRLQETRPIWEQVLVRLEGVEQRIGALENEVRTGFRRIERNVGLLIKDVLEVRADQHDLENRLDQLEPKPTQ